MYTIKDYDIGEDIDMQGFNEKIFLPSWAYLALSVASMTHKDHSYARLLISDPYPRHFVKHTLSL